MAMLSAKQERAFDRERSDGAAAPDGDGLAAFKVAEVRRHETRGKDVRQEKDLFLGQSLRNLDRANVSIGDPEILRLAAGKAAEHVRVAE
jgi:hypothetical protein